jgi:hypothetical protein
MDMKATFAVVNYTAVILAPKELWMWHLCFSDGNGPTPNPTFGVGVFQGRLRFPQKIHCRVRPRLTHSAGFSFRTAESNWENPDPKCRISRKSAVKYPEIPKPLILFGMNKNPAKDFCSGDLNVCPS